jgi:hypothetical protein
MEEQVIELILWKGNAGAYPYSLGMNGGTMWYSVPTGAVHNFYVNGTSRYEINSSGATLTGQLNITHASTAANAGAGGFYVYNPNTGAGNCSILGVRINGNVANRCGISLDVSGHYGWNVGINGNDTTNRMLRFNASWDNSGVDRMTLDWSGNLTLSGTVSANSFTEGGVSLASKYLTSASLDTTYLRLNGANSMAGNLNITGSATNSLIFDDNLNDKKIQMNSNNGFGVAGNGLGFYSSGGFTFRNSTLTTTLFSVDSAGSMSFNGTVYPAQGVSTSANIRGGTACLGTTVSTGATLTVVSSTQLLPRILLSGQEFYAPSNSMTSGIAFLLGVNRTGNKQLWIADSTDLTQNGTNICFKINAG